MENPFNADSNPCSIEQSNSKTNWLHRADRNDLLKILQTFDLSLETSRIKSFRSYFSLIFLILQKETNQRAN